MSDVCGMLQPLGFEYCLLGAASGNGLMCFWGVRPLFLLSRRVLWYLLLPLFSRGRLRATRDRWRGVEAFGIRILVDCELEAGASCSSMRRKNSVLAFTLAEPLRRPVLAFTLGIIWPDRQYAHLGASIPQACGVLSALLISLFGISFLLSALHQISLLQILCDGCVPDD